MATLSLKKSCYSFRENRFDVKVGVEHYGSLGSLNQEEEG